MGGGVKRPKKLDAPLKTLYKAHSFGVSTRPIFFGLLMDYQTFLDDLRANGYNLRNKIKGDFDGKDYK